MVLLQNETYKELKETYDKYFTIGVGGDINVKFTLISLICLLTDASKKNNPDATCYQVIMKVLELSKSALPEEDIIGLAIVCESFLKNSTKFNNCGLKTPNEILNKIREILDQWVPF